MEHSDFKAAFLEHEQQERINTGKVACLLVAVLMPAGVLLDWFVYREKAGYFLFLRLLCSLLALVLWGLHFTAPGQRHYRLVGLPIPLLPAFFITLMIVETNGAESPYYAGLNLILLAISVVVRWSLLESIVSVGAVLAMYTLWCPLPTGTLKEYAGYFSNLYFLILTGIIVVTGNYFFNQLRLSEFKLRFELDQNRRQLEENNRKLKELDELKSRFFANISHELRTPLTLLLAPLEALQHQRVALNASEARELLQIMHANGMRLLKLINDLLDLVRLESGRMEVKREAFALEEFIKGMGNSIRKMAEDKRITFSVSVDAGLGTISADRDKLEKILLNLLFNAVKFTRSGGRVELVANRQAEELVLQVRDTGMGIPEQQLPFIFDRFWQADTSAQRKYQGVGIGLALVKELVEVQAGQVTVESQEGKGTTMTVRIPFLKPDTLAMLTPSTPAVPDPASVSAAPDGESNEWLAGLYRRAEMFPSLTPLQESLRPVETAGAGNRPRVLIADDEPDMLRFLKSQLSANFQVLEAVDGQQAIEKASQFLPDIILLDMMMPEKDGLQACRELRARTPTQNIPIVLLTARADEETKLASLAAGASDFLSKPFSLTELNVRLKNLVESHQLQRRLARQNQILEATLEQLKETESQLVQSEKLASLGRLSAGIIHEINNPLNYAKTGLRTLSRSGKLLPAEQQADFADQLKDIEEGVDRVKTIVSDLRTFTHAGTGQYQTVEVAALITTALRFLSHEWKGQVQIERRIAEGQTIAANQNQLIQVLVNLLQNASDAVKHKQFTGEQPTIWIEGRLENGKSLLIIRDNGAGIRAEHQGKIFDPFFTTKDVGQGMGLGLSICYRIVQEHGGTIQVRSETGKFCEFTLAFPEKP